MVRLERDLRRGLPGAGRAVDALLSPGIRGALTFADGETNVCGLSGSRKVSLDVGDGVDRGGRCPAVAAEADEDSPEGLRVARRRAAALHARDAPGRWPSWPATRPRSATRTWVRHQPRARHRADRAPGAGGGGSRKLDEGVLGRAYSRICGNANTSACAWARSQEAPGAAGAFHAGLGLLLRRPESLHALSRVFHPVSASRD